MYLLIPNRIGIPKPQQPFIISDFGSHSALSHRTKSCIFCTSKMTWTKVTNKTFAPCSSHSARQYLAHCASARLCSIAIAIQDQRKTGTGHILLQLPRFSGWIHMGERVFGACVSSPLKCAGATERSHLMRAHTLDGNGYHIGFE